VFGSESGACQPNIQRAWETLRLLAYGYEPKLSRQGTAWNREQLQRIDLRWHDLRHEGACRLTRRRRRHPHHPADARPREHPADAALSERDRRGPQERTGGELEEQGPTASARISRLNASTGDNQAQLPIVSNLSPEGVVREGIWLRGPATNDTCNYAVGLLDEEDVRRIRLPARQSRRFFDNRSFEWPPNYCSGVARPQPSMRHPAIDVHQQSGQGAARFLQPRNARATIASAPSTFQTGGS
jgi:hypothetical protein